MRMIDADELVRMPWVLPNCMTRETALECFRSIVNESQTVDAVEVVRCKECKHRQDPGECPMCFTEVVDVVGGRMYKFTDLTHDAGYCHRGEEQCE